jgi:hypothetical protein
MDRRARRTLILTATLAAIRSLAAQNPPPRPAPAVPDTAARDTLRPVLVMDELFAVGPSAFAPRVTLQQGMVYRLEMQPAAASVSIRPALHPSQPPLLLIPLEGGGIVTGASQTAAFLLVPHSTEEYRLDVSAGGTEPVRIRIWADPKESARWSRIHAEGFRLPVLAAAVSATFLTSFRDSYGTPYDSLFGYSSRPQSAYGLKTCLAVVPKGRVLPDRVGGCAIALTFWRRGSGRDFYTLGIEPEVVVRRMPRADLAITPQLAFGSSTGGAGRAWYVLLGLGARYTTELTRRPELGFVAEAFAVDVRSLPSESSVPRVSSLALSLGAGLMLGL